MSAMPTQKQVRSLLNRMKALGGYPTCSFKALAKDVGMPPSTVILWVREHSAYYNLTIPKSPDKALPPSTSHVDRQRELSRKRDEKRMVDDLSKKAIRLEDELNVALQIKQNVITHTIKADPTEKSEATAVWLASDWHVEERVTLEQTNGVNEYNPDISKARADAYFVNGLRLTNMMARDISIKTIVLGLLGDFITGHLHSQAVETNYMPPVEAAIYAQNLIASGIAYLLKSSKYELVIVCKSGNHGRTTKFSEFGSENGHSHEFFVYNSLRDAFKNEPRVKFIISEGSHTYLDVYGYTLRFLHGHDMRYAGGVGGLTIPVNKAISQWDKVRQAYCTFFGHFHQRLDGGNWMANGSLIGFNAFALSIKASAEPPAQQMCLIDKQRGKTIVAPILFD